MPAAQGSSDKPPQAAPSQQNNIDDLQKGPATVPTGPRSQSYDHNRRGSYQGRGYNNTGRLHSTDSYNGGNGHCRDRSSSRGGRHNNRGSWDASRAGGRSHSNNYRSTSSSGSPYPSGYSSSGGGRADSRGPPYTSGTSNVPAGRNHSVSRARSQSRPGVHTAGSFPPNGGSHNLVSPASRLANANNLFGGAQNPPSQTPGNMSIRPSSRSNSNGPRGSPSQQLPYPQTSVITNQGPPRAVPTQTNTALATNDDQAAIAAHPSVAQIKLALASLDTAVAQSTVAQGGDAECPQKKKRRNRNRKKSVKQNGGETANGDDADNEGTSASEDASASPLAIKFGADLVTASVVTPQTTITMIPVPGEPLASRQPVGDKVASTVKQEAGLMINQKDIGDADADGTADKEVVRPMLEENRRKDSHFKALPTRKELSTAVEQMEVYTVVVHSRAANEVVNLIKKVTDNLKEGVPDCQHLRRLVKPENLPPSLTGLPESLFIDYSTENQSPSVKVNPDGTLEKVTRSRGASRAQRRRRNASYRKGEKPLYVMLCPVVAMTIRELYEALSVHPMFAGVDLDCEIPFDSQDIPQIIKHRVPQWAPCNLKQANYWTEKYWPTIYRRTNPYGPHPFLINKWEDKLYTPYPIEEMDYVESSGNPISLGEYYMQLARKVAEEGEAKGAGLRIGCVVVEFKEKGPAHGKVMTVTHDARVQSGNPLAHACYRAISLVGRKRVEATARHKPKVNPVALNGPNSSIEDDFYARVPGDPDGYLMNDLVVFVTHEPCVMCTMALVHSRIGCLIYGEPMVSGGLHADLAPPDGHSLPFRGVTEEDVTAYRERHNIEESAIRRRPTVDDGLGGAEEGGDPNSEFQIKVKLPRGKGKNNEENTARKQQFLKETATKLKKEWSPVDSSLKTDEAVIDACKEKVISKKIKQRDVTRFKALSAILVAELGLQEEEAIIRGRIAAGQEVQRKEHKLDKGTQTAKIFNSIKDGEDYLGAVSNVNIGIPSSSHETSESLTRLTKENLQAFVESSKDVGKGLPSANDTQSSIRDPEDGGKFAETCSVYELYAKGVVDKGQVPVNLTPKVKGGDFDDINTVEGDTTLIKGERKGDSSLTNVDSSRNNSPENLGFGGLGGIDIFGVNEDRPTITASAEEKQSGARGEGVAIDLMLTAEAERGRSRVPAPFKPGTGEFVPVNVSYESPPQLSGSSPENCGTTSGGEETTGTAGWDDDSDFDIGTAFDIMTIEAPDAADGNKSSAGGDTEKSKKKRKKKRSRGKKKALAEDNTTSVETEGFQIVETSEAKNDSVSIKVENLHNPTTHGSSTTAQSALSSHGPPDERNTSTTLAASRPQTPGQAAKNGINDDAEEEEQDRLREDEYAAEDEEELGEPDELVRPSRPFRMLTEKLVTGGPPKYDHGPGDGYGLFWREKLNWKFMCFRYKDLESEEEWMAQLEWEGLTNDRISA
ncbi:hypothetical protein DRE_07493 [Drechslerella stenobrocha 248]|uniref:CMP/dCMP-type deaminase domain-containing protein n=1 Tax=Drechslerella stenobrocha 248 TaxID=1043628 RepID=W7HI45_9PEZI|nr:hypothetical protein DRE_07493 [Drechslerella stenobrocha 248]